jgi:hypothetical protein
MSNVLIGIIGVILFIGLALAGALFLGPRFQEAQNSSKASAAVQNMSQISNAVQMWQVDRGERFPAGPADDLVSKGFMKSLPANSIPNGGLFDTRTKEGTYTGNAAYVISGLTNDAQTQKICAEINRQTMGSSAIPTTAGPTTDTQCFYNTEAWGGLPNGMLLLTKAI